MENAQIKSGSAIDIPQVKLGALQQCFVRKSVQEKVYKKAYDKNHIKRNIIEKAVAME